jgi:hypothetical protein
MCFWPSFMRSTYSAREMRVSGDLEEWKRSRGSRRRLRGAQGSEAGSAGAWRVQDARAGAAAGGGAPPSQSICEGGKGSLRLQQMHTR